MSRTGVLAMALILAGAGEDLPVVVPAGPEVRAAIRNPIPVTELHRCITGASPGGRIRPSLTTAGQVPGRVHDLPAIRTP